MNQTTYLFHDIIRIFLDNFNTLHENASIKYLSQINHQDGATKDDNNARLINIELTTNGVTTLGYARIRNRTTKNHGKILKNETCSFIKLQSKYPEHIPKLRFYGMTGRISYTVFDFKKGYIPIHNILSDYEPKNVINVTTYLIIIKEILKYINKYKNDIITNNINMHNVLFNLYTRKIMIINMGYSCCMKYDDSVDLGDCCYDLRTMDGMANAIKCMYTSTETTDSFHTPFQFVLEVIEDFPDLSIENLMLNSQLYSILVILYKCINIVLTKIRQYPYNVVAGGPDYVYKYVMGGDKGIKGIVSILNDNYKPINRSSPFAILVNGLFVYIITNIDTPFDTNYEHIKTKIDDAITSNDNIRTKIENEALAHNKTLLKITSKLSTGSQAVILTANIMVQNKTSVNKVLVKLFNPIRYRDRADELAYYREICALKYNKNIPNTTQMYANGTIGGKYYIILDYFEGYNEIGKYVKDNGKMNHATLMQVVKKLLLGLQSLHKYYAHKDISERNILIHKTSLDIKYIDFGLSCCMLSDDTYRCCKVGDELKKCVKDTSDIMYLRSPVMLLYTIFNHESFGMTEIEIAKHDDIFSLVCLIYKLANYKDEDNNGTIMDFISVMSIPMYYSHIKKTTKITELKDIVSPHIKKSSSGDATIDNIVNTVVNIYINNMEKTSNEIINNMLKLFE
jgi:serine/threonine protein kinase